MEQRKGYSLIEIVIGIVLIMFFLLTTGSLVNAAYTNYRLVLQRNEAIDFAISEMENILNLAKIDTSGISEENHTIMNVGHTKNYMNSTVKVEKITNGNKCYDDTVFLVTVSVDYKKTPSDTKTYSVELQSLKIDK